MIPQYEIDKIIEIAIKYNVDKLYLIGSCLHKDPAETNDYDFAVMGIPEENFFKFYGELFRLMPKNVDLIDLSGKMTKFKSIILREGKLIYDKTAA